MKKVKDFMLTLFFLTGAIGTFAQEDGKLEIPLSEPGKRGTLKVNLMSGSIKITGYNGQTVVINYKSKEKSISKSGRQDGLVRIPANTINLEGSEHDNTVIVKSNSFSRGVNLEIEVPRDFDINAKTHNDGDIVVDNIVGEVVTTNHNGDITLGNISGLALANTFNGDIKIAYNQVTAGIPMSYNTYNGKVDLTLPQGTKANFKMKSAMGEIFSGFDMQLEPSRPETSTDNKSGVYKVKINEWVRGKINGGGPEITIKTYNGDVYIRKAGGN
ncbi:DUF4097 family beta strand repeat-containing protein [Fulvivirgaceae bacterium BMA12]|uniref:DUF4097 family beta strand repeat-containing protein n=1 Tax=Agaribacillus aureus TaxID=3051825 RepID=A0ABT8L468_9BACT|nr:DUF4097 family beta strand repeat-containing protein [Fulvivirgaceae bacterium BMA12]